MAVIPAFWEAEAVDHLRSGVWDQPGQHGESPSLLKIQKLRAWWYMQVISATREAEVGESLEPGSWRLQWAKIRPLHSSLGNKSKTQSWGGKKKESNAWWSKAQVSSCNHLLLPQPWSVKKLSSTKSAPGAKNVGDHWSTLSWAT